ncbi:MAG TPA: hypothetical protein O0X39_05525 [Methanocorpusculum sp.]|nr:hypothetical protein [Methanocorpusculum sp.]
MAPLKDFLKEQSTRCSEQRQANKEYYENAYRQVYENRFLYRSGLIIRIGIAALFDIAYIIMMIFIFPTLEPKDMVYFIIIGIAAVFFEILGLRWYLKKKVTVK